MQQQWQVAADGGYWANPKLSREVRFQAQPLMRFLQDGFVRVQPDFGKGDSETVQFLKMSNVLTAGRRISEDETMPKTKMKTYKDTLTVYELGNAVEWTGKLETLSSYSPNNIVLVGIRDDEKKVRDKEAAAAFQSTDLVYVPTGTTDDPTYTLYTDGTPLVSSTRLIQTYDFKVINRLMKTYNIPMWDGINYMCVSSVNGLGGIVDDPDWKDAAKYGDPERLFAGEVGRYSGIRTLEENNALNGNLPGSCGEMIFFGADPVVQGLALVPEIRYKVPEDYGRDKGLCWISIEGFKITWDFSTEGETHVLRVYSG